MMIRSIACMLTILLMSNAFAEGEDDQTRYQLEQQFAIADAEVQAGRMAAPVMGEEGVSIEQATTIVDEGGNLKIIDKNNPQPNTSAPRAVESMPGSISPGASTAPGTPTLQPYTGPVPEVVPPAKGKGSMQSSAPLELFPNQELTPEAAARGVAPQTPSTPPMAVPGQAPMQTSPVMPNDGQSIPAAPSMPAPGSGTAPMPSQPLPVNPDQAPMQPNTPPSMPMPQGGNMPEAAPPAVDQIR